MEEPLSASIFSGICCNEYECVVCVDVFVLVEQTHGIPGPFDSLSTSVVFPPGLAYDCSGSSKLSVDADMFESPFVCSHRSRRTDRTGWN
eukprot:6965901-Pyramimonas_sp.AAC.1